MSQLLIENKMIRDHNAESGFFPGVAKEFYLGQIDWVEEKFRVAAISVDWRPDDQTARAMKFLSDFPKGMIIATSSPLVTWVTDDGAADADDVEFVNPGNGTLDKLVIYRDTGNPFTSRLICMIRCLIVVTNSSTLTINWDNGYNKVFRL